MPELRLLTDISGHGFGHLAQTAAVLDALAANTNIDLVVRTTHPQAVVSQFISTPHRLAAPPPDPTMSMTGPARVNVSETLASYAQLHDRLDDVITKERDRLLDLNPDIVLANVPYTSLLAASQAGILSVGLCSLNWHDVLAGYCGDRPDAQPILAAIAAGYRSADIFLRPTPAMPMTWLPRARSIGPVARKPSASARPSVLPGIGADAPAIVLLSLGGIRSDLPLDTVPRLDGVHWIVATQQRQPQRPDVTALDDIGASFLELLPHVDAIVAKSGYGSFVEAAACGVRVLYASRPDWPEAPALESWIETHAASAAISQAELYEGSYGSVLLDLLGRPRATPVPATGADEAAKCLLKLAGRRA